MSPIVEPALTPTKSAMPISSAAPPVAVAPLCPTHTTIGTAEASSVVASSVKSVSSRTEPLLFSQITSARAPSLSARASWVEEVALRDGIDQPGDLCDVDDGVTGLDRLEIVRAGLDGPILHGCRRRGGGVGCAGDRQRGSERGQQDEHRGGASSPRYIQG